jgi:signal peptidase I
MIPSLRIGDHILVNKLAYGLTIPVTNTRIAARMPPRRGDVIVFDDPAHPEESLIKRVIALPGDDLDFNAGTPIINGWQVPFCNVGTYAYDDPLDHTNHSGMSRIEFLEDASYLTFLDANLAMTGHQGPYGVGPDEVWVLGDNRNGSIDSRAWQSGWGGGVPYARVVGRASYVWLGTGEPRDWSRVFAPIMGKPPGKGPFGALPPVLAGLEPAIETCLAQRPPRERTTPPPPARHIP